MAAVYKITNTTNGAVCVGITQLSVDARWSQMLEYAQDTDLARTRMPCLRIITSIKKYGAENFTIEPLIEGVYDNETLTSLELEEIAKLNKAGMTVYHRTGTFVPNSEHIDSFCSVDDDDDFFYG
jgi:hypothetical protein